MLKRNITDEMSVVSMPVDWLEIVKDYKTSPNSETQQALIFLIEQFKQATETDIQWGKLATCYDALGNYEAAVQAILAIEKKSKKELKKQAEYKHKWEQWGNTIRTFYEMPTGEQTTIPVFRYCPNPIESGILTYGAPQECECCGEVVNVYSESGLYCIEDISLLCPTCIHSGEAARKFDGDFHQDYEIVSNDEANDILAHRTPGYISWQGNNWVAHCDDHCAFVGFVGVKEIDELGIWDSLKNASRYELDILKEYMRNNGHLQGYLFQCLHCGTYVLYADAS